MKRLSYNQAARKSVYCTHAVHVTIIDPQHHYSGDQHELAIAECDCADREPSTPPGEGEHDDDGPSTGT